MAIPIRFPLACVALALAAAACGSTSAQTLTFNIHVTGTKSNLGDISAREGDTIQMTVTCDKDEEIHLHGFDYKFSCKPSHPASRTFAADRTGVFEYEIESSSTHLGNVTINP